MSKATYNQKHLIGSLLAVSEGGALTNLVGSMVVGRQAGYSTGTVAESLHLIHKQQVERKRLGLA